MYRLKKYITLFFIPVILASSVSFPLIYLEFELNKNYIRDVLCVNRNKPITICGGACYLKNRLEKKQSEKTSSTSDTKRMALALYFEEISKVFVPLDSPKVLLEGFQLEYSFSYIKGIFHPPSSNLI
ncbi:hypothetical protein [Reichenbachiella sp. MALMAid0571]|uniref:hypothetical protein n=1 Tax=Reichenbachiella sp. MALMAid0571 TaxID=3143939 RepID=UPI0032DEB3E1